LKEGGVEVEWPINALEKESLISLSFLTNQREKKKKRKRKKREMRLAMPLIRNNH